MNIAEQINWGCKRACAALTSLALQQASRLWLIVTVALNIVLLDSWITTSGTLAGAGFISLEFLVKEFRRAGK